MELHLSNREKKYEKNMGLVLRKVMFQKIIYYQLSDIGYIANFSTWHVFLLCI